MSNLAAYLARGEARPAYNRLSPLNWRLTPASRRPADEVRPWARSRYPSFSLTLDIPEWTDAQGSDDPILILALLVMFQPPASLAGETPQTILKAWADAYTTRSGDALAVLYAKDAHLWGTMSKEPSIGIDTIKEYFEKGGQSVSARSVTFGRTSTVLRTEAAFISGECQFSATMKDGSLRETAARFSLALSKDGDTWLIVDHHSSVLPK
jgi:uncharacterized protein (TIGR02246 family)